MARQKKDGDDRQLTVVEANALLPSLAYSGEGYVCTFDNNDKHNYPLIIRCLSAPDIPLESAPAIPLAVHDLWVGVVELTDPDSGEVYNAIRTCLVRPDRITISTCSVPALKSLSAISRIVGPPPWRPAILVAKREVVSPRTKRRYFVLDYCGEADE